MNDLSPDLPQALEPPPRKLPLALKVLLYMFQGVRVGRLDVVLPDGARRSFAGTEPGPHGVLQIRDAGVAWRVLRRGEVGFGEAYMDGSWDSPDLARLLMVLYRNEPHYQGPYERNVIGRFAGWVQHKLRANTPRKAAENIRYHYDLGNDFYRLWLDETLAYSCAIFPRSDATLAEAQRHKFDLMLERLRLGADHELLEIGSGWGGFAIHAAQRTGCRVTGITLSVEQLEEARRRAAAAGVGDRVHFELTDYRDVRRAYDRVVSIEMYEAVGEEFWPAWFGAIARALKPGGRAAIQGITIEPQRFAQYRTKRDFIQKYIFPGGMLCPPDRFQALARAAGLAAQDVRFHGADYARTLATWHRNVLAARDAVVRRFDERFLRMWRYYLAYCECGFRVGSIDLLQITLAR